MILPTRWTSYELNRDSWKAIEYFRDERLVATGWEEHCLKAKKKFEALFTLLDYLKSDQLNEEGFARVLKDNLIETLRYLTGPPISEDDLKVLANVNSFSYRQIINDPSALENIYRVLKRIIDPVRFPWVLEDRNPSEEEREAALLASTVLLANQSLATERRNDGKKIQEDRVKKYLKTISYIEVKPVDINTIVGGPQQGQFCGECLVGERKADIVIRLPDTRLAVIECKVSNSATNSVKRLNNDAAAKAEYWLKQFGISQIVPAAMLSGVFNVLNLEQAQKRGLALFWVHDLDQLGAFIKSAG